MEFRTVIFRYYELEKIILHIVQKNELLDQYRVHFSVLGG
jgi:hypothetical protein